MDSITTKLSALSRYVAPEPRRTLILALTELNRAESIGRREPLDEVIGKLNTAMEGGEQ